MNFVTELATQKDAQAIVDFMDHMVGQFGNFTFDAGEFCVRDATEMTAHMEQQAATGGFTILARTQRSKKKGGPELVGLLTVDVGDHVQTEHHAKLSIVIPQRHQRQGIESRLMQFAVGRVERNQAIEVLSCRVLADNAQAIRLCKRFDLEETEIERGLFTIDGKPVYTKVMSRTFHRATPEEGEPFFYLDDILTAIEETNDNVTWYACLDTGETNFISDVDPFEPDDEEYFDPDEAEGTWVLLPDRYEIDDWATMRDFANCQNDVLRNRLLDIIHRRGAYRRFKDECDRQGLLNDYFAFQGRRHREIAIDWLERNGCVWTEGSAR